MSVGFDAPEPASSRTTGSGNAIEVLHLRKGGLSGGRIPEVDGLGGEKVDASQLADGVTRWTVSAEKVTR